MSSTNNFYTFAEEVAGAVPHYKGLGRTLTIYSCVNDGVCRGP